MDRKVFAGWLDEITYACERIKDEDMCAECPMHHYCIEEKTLSDIAYDCPSDYFEEIIKMGDNPTWYVMTDDEKIEAAYENM